MSASSSSQPQRMALPQRLANKPIFSVVELEKHNCEADCWLAINGVVYNVTKFLEEHPGGPEVVVNASARDASEEFEEIGHSQNARELARQYEIGLLEGWEESATGTDKPKSGSTSNSGANPSIGESSWFGGLFRFLVMVGIAVAAYYVIGFPSSNAGTS